MADRYFKNNMPAFVAETTGETGGEGEEEVVAQGSEESLMRLLRMPYHLFSERLEQAALDLKQTVTPHFCFIILCILCM